MMSEVKVLAVFAESRMASFPDAPTLGELGYYDKWYGSARGLVLPKDTPQEVVDFYVDAFGKAMSDPEVVNAHKQAGLALDFMDNKKFAELIHEQEAFCRDVVSTLY